MILSILAKSKGEKIKPVMGTDCNKTVFVYICITIFCGIFGFVYTQFGHGITSLYMTYVFAPPLAAGVFVYQIFAMLKTDMLKYRLSVNMYNSFIATATIAFTIKGIFEIANTRSDYMIVFWIVSALFLAGAVGSFLAVCFRKPETA